MTERVVLEEWNGQRCQRLPISLAWQGEYGALDWNKTVRCVFSSMRRLVNYKRASRVYRLV